MDRHGRRLLDALDAAGVLLQHDTRLPSASAAVVGGSFPGSWWAHPMCHDIYRALNDLDDEGFVVRCKLLAGKVTLVARHLWPDLLAVVTERAPWQTDQLTRAAARLLDDVDGAEEPLLLHKGNRDQGTRLERALLVHGEQVHLDSGRHTKGLVPWSRVEREHGVARSSDPSASRAAIEAIVDAWGSRKRLVPWPPG